MTMKLVCADLDGTLLHSDQSVSSATQRAVTRAQAAGIHFAISTGRTLHECRQILARLPQVRYISSSSGALVADLQTGRTIHEAYLKPGTVRHVYERLKPFHKIFCCLFGSKIYYDSAVWRYEDQYDPHWVAYVREFYTALDDFEAFIRENEQPVEKLFMIFPDRAERDRAWEAANTSALYISASSSNNLEITAPDANKGASMDALRRHLGLERTQTMAIGDSENDLRMLGYAAVPVVMANADEQIKKIAALVAPSNDDDGVAWVLDRLVEGKI